MRVHSSLASTIDIEIPEHENPDELLKRALKELGFYDRIAEDIVNSGATITIRKSYRDIPKNETVVEYYEEDEC